MFVVKWLSSTWGDDEAGICPVPVHTARDASGQPVSGGPWQHYRGTGGACSDALDVDGRIAGKARSVFRKYPSDEDDVEQLNAYLTMTGLPEPECETAIKHHDVELKNVHFSYSGEKKDEVLHGIDLTLPEEVIRRLWGRPEAENPPWRN